MSLLDQRACGERPGVRAGWAPKAEPGARVPQMILTLGTRNPGFSWENRSAHGEAACI
jgi:hypothetical protein